jgi:ERCC4-type nuclease
MILIDPRTGSKDLLDPIQKRVNCDVRLFTLESGDVAFEGNGPNGRVMIGVERKQIKDMIGSIRSDRLAAVQLKRMSAEYDVVYVLVEGIFRPSPDGTLEVYGRRKGSGFEPLTLATKARKAKAQTYRYSEYDKHICTLENKKNVIILRSSSQMETAWQIVNRFNWWSKPWGEHRSDEAIKYQGVVTFRPVSPLRRFASDLPGIGWKKSAAVEKHFGSIENAVLANPEGWAEIEGIGLATGEKLYKLIRSRCK